MFLDIDVVTAARQRVEHVFDTFDTVCVQVSGGKDSLAALLLVKEFHDRHGLGPVKAIFRDEEMVSPAVVRWMEWLREQPWCDLEWYCLKQGQEVWVLGRRESIVMWSDLRREAGLLARPIPPWAITAQHFGIPAGEPLAESIDYYTMQGKKGRVAFVTGVRANESMVRYRSLVQKLHENYIVQPYKMKKSIPLRFAKIIYDWTTDDVFKYVSEEHPDIPYCEFYDLAALTGSNTRVGIPLHSVAIRRIGDVIATEPEFFDKLYSIFPEIDAQRRLWPEFDVEALVASYSGNGWDGVKRCIDDNMLSPGIRRRALAYASKYRDKHARDPYSYPLDWLIRNLLLNEFHITAVTPVGPKTKADAIRRAQAEADANSLDLQDDLR